MGICLSCLKPNQTIQEDEDVSLLSDDKAKVVENELLTELRNKQLNAILNSTNDHLIDITTFKNMSNYGSFSQHTAANNNNNNNNNNNENENDEHSQIQQDENDILKIIPISQSTINEEMDSQYKDWVAKFGENAVRKNLEIKIDPKDKNEKYIVDLD